MKEENEDKEIVFEPDDALILALNEVNNLRELMEEQDSEIDKLKKELLSLKKAIKKVLTSDRFYGIIMSYEKNLIKQRWYSAQTP